MSWDKKHGKWKAAPFLNGQRRHQCRALPPQPEQTVPVPKSSGEARPRGRSLTIGVSWDKKHGKWKAAPFLNGQRRHQCRALPPQSVQTVPVPKSSGEARPRGRSLTIGVSWDKKHGKWKAAPFLNGQRRHQCRALPPQPVQTVPVPKSSGEARPRGRSLTIGVSWDKKHGKWKAAPFLNGQRRHQCRALPPPNV